MEVHLGKCRTDNFECGFCESTFKELNDLKLHLKTCEVYECNSCYLGFQNISDIKKTYEKFIQPLQQFCIKKWTETIKVK